MSTRQFYQVASPEVAGMLRELNFLLGHISDRLDKLESLRGTSEVFGDATVSGNLTVTGTLDSSGEVGGTTPAPSTVTTFNATGAVDFDSTLNVDGATTLAGVNATTIGATGAVDFDSTLNVDGSTTLVAVTASGAVILQGTLAVTGASTIGDLTTNGANLGDTLLVPETIDLEDAVSAQAHLLITGRASIGGGLEVANEAVIGGGLSTPSVAANTGEFSGNIEFFGDDGNRVSGFIR